MTFTFAPTTDRLSYSTNIPAMGAVGAVAFWIKTTSAVTNCIAASCWNTTSRRGWGIILNNTANKVTLAGYSATTNRVLLASATTINDGNWHHLCFNINRNSGGGNAIYFDGASDATANSSDDWTDSVNSFLCWGQSFDTFWPCFAGSLAEGAYWEGRQLDAAEIAALAKGASPRLIAPDILKFYTPLIRDPLDIYDATYDATTGTSIADHIRIFGGTAR